MELQLQHLAPYLPYELKIFYQIAHRTITMTALQSDIKISTNFKPLLYPFILSELTTEHIDKKGRKFIPAKILWSVSAREEEDFDVYGATPDYWQSCIAVKPTDLEYLTVSKLFEWHFDVFGLIDAKLALNKRHNF